MRSLRRTCCGTPAALPWPMLAMTHAPCRRTLVAAIFSTRFGTLSWRRANSRISGGDGPSHPAGNDRGARLTQKARRAGWEPRQTRANARAAVALP